MEWLTQKFDNFWTDQWMLCIQRKGGNFQHFWQINFDQDENLNIIEPTSKCTLCYKTARIFRNLDNLCFAYKKIWWFFNLRMDGFAWQKGGDFQNRGQYSSLASTKIWQLLNWPIEAWRLSEIWTICVLFIRKLDVF